MKETATGIEYSWFEVLAAQLCKAVDGIVTNKPMHEQSWWSVVEGLRQAARDEYDAERREKGAT